MAKSLRSKIKRKFRAVRREKIHKPVEDARLQRLAEKAKAELAEQKAAEMETEAVEEQVEEGKEAAEGMDVDPKKIDPMLFLSRRKQRLVKMKKAGKVKKGQKVLGKRRR